MKRKLIFILILFMLFIPNKVFALNEVNVFLFYSDSCNICSQEKTYLQALKSRYPNMRIYSYEVSNQTNNELMLKAKKLYNIVGEGVPFTIIGDKAYLGFSQSKKALFQKYVYEYSNKKYSNKLGSELGINYRTDLEGTVQEYKDNDSYQIEESSGKPHTNTSNENNKISDKYRATIYLVSMGVGLGIIALIIYLIDRKRG